MKTTATKLAKQRRDVPQLLGLLRTSRDTSDVSRQEEDLMALEIEHSVQIYRQLAIEGLSGTATLRNQDIVRLLRELDDPGCNGLALSALDRLGRATRGEALAIIDPFIDARKPIYSLREGILKPWDDEDYVTCINALVRGGSEMRETRRRSMGKQLGLAKLGAHCCATAAYGYRFSRSLRLEGQKKLRGTWTIYAEEAKIVREIYRRYAELQWSSRKIAKWLNDEGIPSAKGGQWTPPVVRQILKNPCYVGRARFRKGKPDEQEIPVEAILQTAAELQWWDAAQVQRAKNKERRAGRPSSNYLLQHKIYCARPGCGKRVTGRRAGRHAHKYECSTRATRGFAPVCGACEIRAKVLEAAIWAALMARLTNPRMIALMLEAYRDQERAMRPVGPSTEERLEKLRADAKALGRTLGDGALEFLWEENRAKLLAVKSEIAVLERELESAAKTFVMPSLVSIKDFAKDMAAIAESDEFAVRRGVIERVVERINYADGVAEVVGRFPTAQLSLESGVQNWNNGVGADTNFVPFVFNVRIAA